MGQPLTIQNKTNDGIYVEWKTAGGVFVVAGYSIGANSSRTHTEQAVWYDIYITYKGKQWKQVFYGGSPATWQFNGQGIQEIIGRSESSPAPKNEAGVISLPLDNPVVNSVVLFFKNLGTSAPEIKSEWFIKIIILSLHYFIMINSFWEI